MMKIFFLIFHFILVCIISSAQTNTTAELKRQVASSNEDANRVDKLNELGRSYRFSNPDSLLFYTDQAIELAKKINYQKGESLALSLKSFAYREMGNLPKALELILKALKIAQEIKSERLEGSSLIRIGQVYQDIKENSKAIKNFKNAIQKLELTDNKFETAICYMSIGMVFEQMNQLDSALFYEKKALNFKMQEQFPDILRTLGNIEAKKGNTHLALVHYKKGLELGLTFNEKRTTSFLYGNLAQLFRQMKQPDSSIFYAKKGLEHGKMVSSQKGILLSSSLLSEMYESINTKESLRYYKIASSAKDILFGAGNIQAIQSLIEQEQERRQEVEKTRLAYNNKLKIYALLAGLTVFLLISFILYRNNKKEKNAKELLQEKNELIEQSLANLKSAQDQLIQSEKLASLGELTAGIAHEIQNPLNFVNNFSELSEELIDEMNDELSKGKTEEVKAIASDLKLNLEKIHHHGIRASSIVKGMLEHSRTSTGEKELTDINALADEYLRLAYHGLRAKDKDFNSDFKTDFDENLPKIKVIPQDIGRVLLNLINNAFYAVKSKDKPLVVVLTKKVDDQIVISVKDNGIGMSDEVKAKIFQPFFTTKPTGQGTGLGLSLAYDIITKGHGGNLEVESIEGVGTEFIIILNI